MDQRILSIVRCIVEIEEAIGDYRCIDTLAREALRIINEEDLRVDPNVYHYIDDYDTRMDDLRYRRDQISRIKSALLKIDII